MKWRPPLRTSELLAYNWGARAREDGYDLGEIYPMENLPPLVGLEAGEVDALSRLGPDAFQKWATRGWVEASPRERVE